MDANHIEDRRDLLKTKLLGFTEPFNERSYHYPELHHNSAKKKDGVWIIPAEYHSRSYPYYIVDNDGEVYFDMKNENIHAFLLEPRKLIKPKNKGVVALHQHAKEFGLGKSEVVGLKAGKSPGQAYGLELAKRGYTVLAFDFLPFESRTIDYESTRDYWGERFVKQDYTMVGAEPMGIHVLDTMRAVDFLDAHGLQSLGVIGHSLGGMVAVYSMACDPRIKAGVSNCGISTFESVSKGKIVHNWAWSVHDIMVDFGEVHKLFQLIAERPFLTSTAKQDKNFPIEGVRQLHEWSGRFYQNTKLLELYEFDGGHSFPMETREKAYMFLDDHL